MLSIQQIENIEKKKYSKDKKSIKDSISRLYDEIDELRQQPNSSLIAGRVSYICRELELRLAELNRRNNILKA